MEGGRRPMSVAAIRSGSAGFFEVNYEKLWMINVMNVRWRWP